MSESERKKVINERRTPHPPTPSPSQAGRGGERDAEFATGTSRFTDEKTKQEQVSRRGFLRGMVIAAASIPVVASGCSPAEEAAAQAIAQPGFQPQPRPPVNPEVPFAPLTSPDPTVLRIFTPHEARTVEALTARILPGTPDDPGAREAGVVIYIDHMLSFHEGFNEATYREPPYVQVYSGDSPPDTSEEPFQTVWVHADDVERYGYQSVLSPREVYRLGVIAVDAYCQAEFGAPFVELSEDDQDTVIEAMVSGEATTGFDQFAAPSFFQVLRRHTAEGMFSDPAYGGNRNMVGWKLIGYPGAQRAYTEQEIRAEAMPREPQSLAQMHAFSPGENAGPFVVLPVSGSEQELPVYHNHP